MNCLRTRWGVVIGEKYLTACEALDLLHWLSEQQDTLLRTSQERLPWSSEPSAESPRQTGSSQADEQEMRSEDEQIACFEL